MTASSNPRIKELTRELTEDFFLFQETFRDDPRVSDCLPGLLTVSAWYLLGDEGLSLDEAKQAAREAMAALNASHEEALRILTAMELLDGLTEEDLERAQRRATA